MKTAKFLTLKIYSSLLSFTASCHTMPLIFPLSRHGALSFPAITHFIFFIIIIWFVRLLALRPLLAYVPASGDSEDDCGKAGGM
jgi:hypothetical protein